MKAAVTSIFTSLLLTGATADNMDNSTSLSSSCTSSYLVGASSRLNKTSYLSGDCIHKPCNLTTAFAKAYHEANTNKEETMNVLACFNLQPGLYQNTFLPPNNTAVHILPTSFAPKYSVIFGSNVTDDDWFLIFNQKGGNVTYQNLVFNKVLGDGMTDQGSAILLNNGTMHMLGCTVIGCTAADGGAIAILGNKSSAIITQTSFSGLKNGGGRFGGAIYSESDLVIDDCHFDGLASYAGIGGAIYSGCMFGDHRDGCDPNGVSLLVRNSTFQNLHSQTWADHSVGGAIYSKGLLKVVSSSFFNCTADSSPPFYPPGTPGRDDDGLGFGGCIFSGGNSTIVIDSTFVQCRARWNSSRPCGGGAISNGKDGGRFGTMRNNTFKHNVGGDVNSWYQHTGGGDTCNVSMQ